MTNVFLQAEEILALSDNELFESARRLQPDDNKIGLCAIINIRSGACSMKCKFCPQSAYVKSATTYGLLDNGELKKRIDALADWPVQHIGLVASGAALSGSEFERLCNFASSLPQNLQRRLCASVGRISREQMRKLFDAGIQHYHHNLETSRNFYPAICDTQDWRERYATVKSALNLGFETCSGFLFGLGETWRDRVDLAQSLKSAGIKNVPMNFLHPAPGTPLCSRSPLTAKEGLRIIALMRHLLPDATLRVCGGRKITFKNEQNKVLQAGANALMTGDFLTTKGEALQADLQMIKDAGYSLID